MPRILSSFSSDIRTGKSCRREAEALGAVPDKETRNTRQKQMILASLKENGGRHMTAPDICSDIRQRDEKISVATVYRNLRMMEEQGIVKKVYMSEDTPMYYELSENAAHTPHHLVCNRCGTIIDFDEDMLDSLEQEIEKKKGFLIKDHRVVFYGLCAKCRAEEEKEKEKAGR